MAQVTRNTSVYHNPHKTVPAPTQFYGTSLYSLSLSLLSYRLTSWVFLTSTASLLDLFTLNLLSRALTSLTDFWTERR